MALADVREFFPLAQREGVYGNYGGLVPALFRTPQWHLEAA